MQATDVPHFLVGIGGLGLAQLADNEATGDGRQSEDEDR